MKTKLAILVMLLCLVGCGNNPDSPESAADKYLSELKSDLSEIGFYSSRKHDSRSLALIINEQADSIINDGAIPATNDLFDKYFQDNVMFYRWELMDVTIDTLNIYEVWDFTESGGEIYRKTILEMYKRETGEFDNKKLCRITDKAAAILKHKGVPKYALKYKVDKKHIDFVGDKYKTAEVGVIKHPENGYKIVSFTWQE